MCAMLDIRYPGKRLARPRGPAGRYFNAPVADPPDTGKTTYRLVNALHSVIEKAMF